MYGFSSLVRVDAFKGAAIEFQEPENKRSQMPRKGGGGREKECVRERESSFRCSLKALEKCSSVFSTFTSLCMDSFVLNIA